MVADYGANYLTPWVGGWQGGGLMGGGSGYTPWGSAWGSVEPAQSTPSTSLVGEARQDASVTNTDRNSRDAQPGTPSAPMTAEQQARAREMMAQAGEYATKNAALGLASTGANIAMGMPVNVGNVLQSGMQGFVSPANAIALAGNVVAEQMGMSKPEGLMGFAPGVAGFGLSAINPVLGLGWGLFGPFVTDAAMDYFGLRTNEDERESLEGRYGEIAGRSQYGNALENARRQAIADSLSMSPSAGLARAEALHTQKMNSTMEASLAPQMRAAMAASKIGPQAQGLMGGWSATNSLAARDQREQEARAAAEAAAQAAAAAQRSAAARAAYGEYGGGAGTSGHNVGGARGTSTGTGGGYNNGRGGVSGL